MLLVGWMLGAVALASDHGMFALAVYVAMVGGVIGLRRQERRWD